MTIQNQSNDPHPQHLHSQSSDTQDENTQDENTSQVDNTSQVESNDERAARLQAFANRGGSIPLDEYKQKSRRAFLGFGAAAVGGFLGFKRLQARPEDGNIPDFLRAGFEWNEKVWDVVGRDGAGTPTYSISDREGIRVNGIIGMRDSSRDFQEIDTDLWSLRTVGSDGQELERLRMPDIQALEQQDMVWLHKCVEGWSNVVHWTGARFSDFARRYANDMPSYKYVSLRTPDNAYFVGLNKADAMNHQTLLAWGLNGEPLSQRHGAPLRLATGNKYGIKQLKRIGTIEFTNERPNDYWAQRGYDWDAGF